MTNKNENTQLSKACSVKQDAKILSSSADNVDSHLQQLENKSLNVDARQHSIESQLFTKEELARLINPDKLANLMVSSDDLVNYLTREIEAFDKRGI